jgi:hypothetical protein
VSSTPKTDDGDHPRRLRPDRTRQSALILAPGSASSVAAWRMRGAQRGFDGIRKIGARFSEACAARCALGLILAQRGGWQ